MKTVYLVRHTEYANPRNILAGRLPLKLSEEVTEKQAIETAISIRSSGGTWGDVAKALGYKHAVSAPDLLRRIGRNKGVDVSAAFCGRKKHGKGE